jgi:hypothetical protein
MWISVLDHGLQWCDRLLVFAQGDPFERFVPESEATARVEVTAVLMVLSLIIAAAAILAKILL